MGETLTLSLANRISELPHLTEAIGSFLEQKKVAREVIDTAQLTLDELVSNAILWGYEDNREHLISVKAATTPTQVCLIIEDDGREFDPTSMPPPDTRLRAEHREEGGLGLHLVRSMADEVTYARVDGHNVVEVKIPSG